MTNGNDNVSAYEVYQCLTKREYFAAMAMQGLLTRGYNPNQGEMVAELSVIFSDSLIDKLNKQP